MFLLAEKLLSLIYSELTMRQIVALILVFKLANMQALEPPKVFKLLWKLIRTYIRTDLLMIFLNFCPISIKEMK